MELNEQQLNRILALIDSKIDTAVTTKLSQLIPDQNVQNMTAFEHIFMKGYVCGNPLQQGTFREFLRRCHLDTLGITASDDLTITYNPTTKVYNISGLILKTDIANCTKHAYNRIIVAGTPMDAATKEDHVTLEARGQISISLDLQNKKVIVRTVHTSTPVGGNSVFSETPDYFPVFTDSISIDNNYPFSIVEIISTQVTISFTNMKLPRYDFLIKCGKDIDITNDLSNAGITLYNQQCKFETDNVYMLTILRTNDAANPGSIKYIAISNKYNI